MTEQQLLDVLMEFYTLTEICQAIMNPALASTGIVLTVTLIFNEWQQQQAQGLQVFELPAEIADIIRNITE